MKGRKMSKLSTVEDLLRHTDEEITEHLYILAAETYRGFNETDDPVKLLKYFGNIEQVFLVLRALKQRNDGRKVNNEL